MKILLLGDSIRMGYDQFVCELLKDKAEVVYPPDNGRFAQYTLRQLQDWKAQLHLACFDEISPEILAGADYTVDYRRDDHRKAQASSVIKLTDDCRVTILRQ